MDERLPYEDELVNRLNDLPLPSEEMAWKDMRRRLEKDDEDRPIIPPLLKGCGGYALLFALLAIALLLVIDPAKWFHPKVKEHPVPIKVDQTKAGENKDKQSGVGKTVVFDSSGKMAVSAPLPLTEKDSSGVRFAADTSFKTDDSLKISPPSRAIIKSRKQYTRTNDQALKTTKHIRRPNDKIKPKRDQPKPVTKHTKGRVKMKMSGAAPDSVDSNMLNSKKSVHQQQDANTDSSFNVRPKAESDQDSIKSNGGDTIAFNKKSKSDSLEHRALYFGAGLGIHQLLPIAGQKGNPYNSLGRKSSLGDYIPSVYLRLYKDRRWFIQSEFRYGAPQYTKEVIFNQKKVIDSGGIGIPSVITTNSSIKKTFYHQLPLSFNYFILPGLSIGTGLTFNKFKSALVQQEVHKADIQFPVDSLVSTALTTQKKADSNFVTTYIQGLFEIQYQWKRISAGARYSFGLTPYLKFQLPGGEERREKNSSLQVFLRYEFWRSLKKK